nr:MAG TPA: hypothetical protein [Caudoviricetes sp.]
MKTLHINNHEIKVYDSIDELPIINFQKYNKYVLIDSGLGSDIDSVNSHIANLISLLNSDLKKAQQQLQNLQQSLFLLVSEVSPKNLAFAALIYSFDGEIVTDLSDENLKHILSLINTEKQSNLNSIFQKIKKKLSSELEIYFPKEFYNVREKEVYDLLKKRVLLILKGVIDDIEYSDEIFEIDKFFFDKQKINNFNGSTSIEVLSDKQFETSCLYISQKANINAKNLNVLEFYAALHNLNKQAEAEMKAYSRIKKH